MMRHTTVLLLLLTACSSEGPTESQLWTHNMQYELPTKYADHPHTGSDIWWSHYDKVEMQCDGYPHSEWMLDTPKNALGDWKTVPAEQEQRVRFTKAEQCCQLRIHLTHLATVDDFNYRLGWSYPKCFSNDRIL